MIDEIEAAAHTFLQGNESIATGQIQKILLDFYKETDLELFLDGFDDEQVYQQIEHGLTHEVLQTKDDLELFEPEDFDESEGEQNSEAGIGTDNENEVEEEKEVENSEDEIEQPDAKKAKFEEGSDFDEFDENEFDDEELESKGSGCLLFSCDWLTLGTNFDQTYSLLWCNQPTRS